MDAFGKGTQVCFFFLPPLGGNRRVPSCNWNKDDAQVCGGAKMLFSLSTTGESSPKYGDLAGCRDTLAMFNPSLLTCLS